MPTDPALLKRFPALRKALLESLRFGINEYANGGTRARPIVDAHFTAGNAERYGWAPLSAEYAARKAAGIVQGRRGVGTYLDAAERTLSPEHQRELARHRGGSKLATIPTFHRASKAGQAAGLAGAFGSSAGNLPMLVLFGDLRRAVNSRNHLVKVFENGRGVATFRGLPDYGLFHHLGAGKLPRRSPVEPNAEDREAVVEAMKRYLARTLRRGKGGAGAVVTVSG
jgi:hypothetical protein